MQQQVCPHLRYMIRRDLPEVLAIEEASFEHAWAETDFLAMLRQKKTIGLVAELADRVIGFVIYTAHRREGCLEVVNVAVAQDWRRRGVGSRIVQRLKGRLDSQYVRLQAVLRETNLPAQLFFRHHGFRAVQTVPRYFEDSGEDGYVLQFGSVEAPIGHNWIAGLDESCA